MQWITQVTQWYKQVHYIPFHIASLTFNYEEIMWNICLVVFQCVVILIADVARLQGLKYADAMHLHM